MVQVGVVDVDFRASTTKFNQAVERTQGRLGKFRSTIGGVGKAFGSFGTMAGVAGAGGLIAFTKHALNSADAISKQRKAAGVGADFFQEYMHAAGLAGISQDKFAKATGTFNKRLGELRNDTGALFGFLKKYDEGMITALQNTSNTEEAFDLFMTSIANTGDQSEKAALAAAGFSKSLGIDMVEMTRQGMDALMQTRQEAHELGKVLSDVALTDAEAANDAMSKLTTSLGTMSQAFVLGAAPAIAAGADGLTTFFKVIRDGEALHGIFDMAIVNMKENVLVFGDVLGMVPDWFEQIRAAAVEKFSAMNTFVQDKIETFISFFAEVPDKVIGYLQQTVDGVKTWMGQKLESALAPAKGFITDVKDSFFQLYDEVVGRSYIPDLVDEVGLHIGRLREEMQIPIENFTAKAGDSFEQLSKSAAASFGEIIAGASSLEGAFSTLLGDFVGTQLDNAGYGQVYTQGTGAFGNAVGAYNSFQQAQNSDSSSDAALGYLQAGYQGYQAYTTAQGAFESYQAAQAAQQASNAALVNGSQTGAALSGTTGGTATATTFNGSAGALEAFGGQGAQVGGTTGGSSTAATAGIAAIAFAVILAVAANNKKGRQKEQQELLRSIQQDTLAGGFSTSTGDFLGINETKRANGHLEGYIRTANQASISYRDLANVVNAAGGSLGTGFNDGESSFTFLTGDIQAATQAFSDFTPRVNQYFENAREKNTQLIQSAMGVKGSAEEVERAQRKLAGSWQVSMKLVRAELTGVSETASVVFTGSTSQAQQFADIFRDGIVEASEASLAGVEDWGGGTVTQFIAANNASGKFTAALDRVSDGYYSLNVQSDGTMRDISSTALQTGRDLDKAFGDSTTRAVAGFFQLEKAAANSFGKIKDSARDTAKQIGSFGVGGKGEGGGFQGFAKGGSFVVPGSGGTDSKLVPILATPGERVTVETPDQQKRSSRGGDATNQLIEINKALLEEMRVSNRLRLQQINAMRAAR